MRQAADVSGPWHVKGTNDAYAQILASPAAMQIRQLEALQNMARAGTGSKVIFGKSLRTVSRAELTSVPMNLGGMGAAGLEGTPQQIAASGASSAPAQPGNPNMATNAGIISSMAQL